MNAGMQAGIFPGRTIRTGEFAGLRLVDGVYSAGTRVPEHAHPTAVFCIGLTGLCNEVFAGRRRQYTAATVEFLRRLRVERARGLLRFSGDSLAMIAAGAGFADQGHLCRTFKRLMRMTPAQYRAGFRRH